MVVIEIEDLAPQDRGTVILVAEEFGRIDDDDSLRKVVQTIVEGRYASIPSFPIDASHEIQVVTWLAEETVLGLGLDRRMEQRDAD